MLVYYLKMILLSLVAAGGGALSAAGLFAIITSVGLINRFARVSKTTKHIMLYEEMIILGVTIGNLAVLFHWKMHNFLFLAVIFAILSGVFIGSFIICLAETLKALPVFIRRVRIANGLGYIVLGIALGKGIGNLIYQLILYK